VLFRPHSREQDMKNTLLHEMIHAYLFLSKGNKDREDHGPNFLSKAYVLAPFVFLGWVAGHP
jgi:hypothetical protein